MEFRYDFGQNLDLSRFKNHLLFVFRKKQIVNFRIYTEQYVLDLDASQNKTIYYMSAEVYENIKDSDGEIFASNRIFPHVNSKLKVFGHIQKIFGYEDGEYCGVFIIEDPELTVKEVITLIKILHKWKNIKAFS